MSSLSIFLTISFGSIHLIRQELWKTRFSPWQFLDCLQLTLTVFKWEGVLLIVGLLLNFIPLWKNLSKAMYTTIVPRRSYYIANLDVKNDIAISIVSGSCWQLLPPLFFSSRRNALMDVRGPVIQAKNPDVNAVNALRVMVAFLLSPKQLCRMEIQSQCLICK